MKKLLAILLALAMVFSMMMFVGCSEDADTDEDTSNSDKADKNDDKDDDEDDTKSEDNTEKSDTVLIVGEWEGEYDLSEVFKYALGEDFNFSNLKVTAVYTFTSDSSYTFAITEIPDSVVEKFAEQYTASADAIMQAEDGVSLEQYIINNGGTSVDDYVKSISDTIFEAIKQEQNGKYMIADGKLYTSDTESDDPSKDDNPDDYKFNSDDSLSITEKEDGVELTVTYSRK